MNNCGFNKEPFCSDVCGDDQRHQTLAEICRNMGICCVIIIIIVYVPWWQGGSSPWWDELYRVVVLCMLLWLLVLPYVLVGCGAGPRCILCWLLLFLGCLCCWRIFHCCTLYTHLPGGGLRILLGHAVGFLCGCHTLCMSGFGIYSWSCFLLGAFLIWLWRWYWPGALLVFSYSWPSFVASSFLSVPIGVEPWICCCSLF